MFYSNTLNLIQVGGGTQVKQGDLGSRFSYKLANEKEQELDNFDKEVAHINLVLNDKIVFTTTATVDNSTVNFNIDKAIPVGLYFLEIKVRDYIFPSDKQTIIFVQSGAVAYDLEELVPDYDVNMTLKGILSDLSQKGIDISDLNRRIAEKVNKDEVTNVMTPKGTLAYASLPTSGNQVGWYYYCPDGDGIHGAGNYVWNGTSWFFGGTGDEGYNLLKEDLAEIEPKGCYNLLTKIKPYNLIKINKLLENHYVDTNGIVKESDDFALTEFIDVSSYTTINFDNCGLSCWYDENRTFISYFTPNKNVPYDVPENAKYIRSSIPTGSINYAIISEQNPIINFDNGYSIFENLYPQKKEYQEGFIRFTVPVNQNIFDYTTTIDNTIDSQTIIDVDCVLTLPASYKHIGKPTKLLMVCHGAGKGVSGGGEFDWTTNHDYCRLVTRFIESGYAVFDCSGYNNNSSGYNFWGAQRGIEAWRKAYQYVIDNYNVEKCFSIYGFSMGGCTALNLAFQKFPNINSIIVSSPVIDLEACFNGDIGAAGAMSHAYGFEDSSGGFQDSMRLQSPINRIVSINDVDYCFDYIPPIRIYFGGNEVGKTGVNKQYAIRLHNAIKNAGGYSEYREVAGRGHEICYGADNAIITEYIYWFNRYSN